MNKLLYKQVGFEDKFDLLVLLLMTLFLIIASYLSSLSHTRAGITDAMIACDAVNILCEKLYSKNDEIRFASAVTLCYLTFNRTASRYLLHNCRNVPHLFDKLMSIIRPETKISQQFIESYQTALQLGLPKLLARNKVKFFEQSEKRRKQTEPLISEIKTDNSMSKFYMGSKQFTINDENNHSKVDNQKKFKSSLVTNRSQSAPISNDIRSILETSKTPTKKKDLIDSKLVLFRPVTQLNMKHTNPKF